MNKKIMIQLSVIYFLICFALGASFPIMSLYLKDVLGFSGKETGIVLAMSSIAAFISPLLGAFIADRIISAERLLTITQLLSGLFMLLLYFQRTFFPVLIIYLLYVVISGPAAGLLNAIIFHHSKDGKKSFGAIRLWGTIGWIVVAWLFSFFWLRGSGTEAISGRIPHALILSGITYLALALYTLFLPISRKKREEVKSLIPKEAFQVMLKPEVILISVLTLFVSAIDRYYYFGMAPFLKQLGFSDAMIMPAMSLGQIPEVFAMALLGPLLAKLGYKKIFLIGIVMQIIRFTVFSSEMTGPLLLFAIAIHGLTYTFFGATIFIYLDGYCDERSRTGVQQLLSIITRGVGSLVGSIIAGAVMDLAIIGKSELVNYKLFWLVPAVMAALIFVTIIFTVRGKRIETTKQAV